MSDYLSEEEQLARLHGWWKRNGTALVVGFVLVAAGVLGWQWYRSYTIEQVNETAEVYAEFLAASGAAQASLGDEIVSGGNATAYPVLVLLRRAQEAVTAGDLAAAEGRLTDALALKSEPVLTDLVRLRLARVQHALGRHDDALATLETIRSAGYLSVAHELKGDIHLVRDERALAHAAYVAALAEVLAEDQRALLEIKVADTADASDA